MAITFTPESVGGGFTGTDNVQANFQNLQTLLQDALSRSGSSPNTMSSDLDMNSNLILNLAQATSAGHAVEYTQFTGQADKTEFTGYTVEEQTATLNQTVFTLLNSYTPGIASMRVYINGVYQAPSGYVEDSTTQITLSEGLEAGDTIAFVISAFTAASSLNASAVVYDPASPGIATNVQAKLREYVSPEDFSAVGDGVTDDTAALESALATGVTVQLKSGSNYLITSTVSLVANSAIIGYGSTITMSTAFINPTSAAGTRFASDAIGLYGLSADNIHLEGFKLVKAILDGVHVIGIALRGCDDTRIVNVDLSGFAMGGMIVLDSCDDAWVQGCNLHDSTSDVTEAGTLVGVWIDQDLISSAPSNRIHIINNKFINLLVGAARLAAVDYQTIGIVTSSSQLTHGTVVQGNYMDTVGNGINIGGEFGVYSDNTIKAAYTNGFKVGSGASFNHIHGNTITDPGRWGISLLGSSSQTVNTKRNVIENNFIYNVDFDSNFTATADVAGIALDDNGGTTFLGRSNIIRNNLVMDDQGSPSTKHAIYSAGAGTNNEFYGNVGLGMSTGYSLRLGTADSTIVGHTISHIKPADVTRVSSASLANDNDLFGYDLLPTTLYEVDGLLLVGSVSATPDFQFVFQVSTALADGLTSAMWTDSAGVSSSDNEDPDGTAMVIPLAANLNHSIHLKGYILTGAAATTLDFQWAQNTSDGDGTIFNKGSYLKFTAIG